MLNFLLRKLRGVSTLNHKHLNYTQAGVSHDKILVAIGDIHGQLSALTTLFTNIEATLPRNLKTVSFVLLGDYIDRGPSSKAVIDLLLDWTKDHNCTFLLGNHEASLLSFLDDPIRNKNWLSFGGIDTLISYNIFPKPGAVAEKALVQIRDQLAERLPDQHIKFFNSLIPSYQDGDFMFVHAGVNPKLPLSKNTEEDLLWIRDPFLKHRGLYEKVIVHGHTITSDAKPEIHANRVGLDTGSYATGVITAMIMEGRDKSYISSEFEG